MNKKNLAKKYLMDNVVIDLDYIDEIKSNLENKLYTWVGSNTGISKQKLIMKFYRMQSTMQTIKIKLVIETGKL